MNFALYLAKIKSVAAFVTPYLKPFFVYLWQNKIYNLITFVLGILIGTLIF